MYRPEAVPLALFVLVALQLVDDPGPERGHPPHRAGGGLGRAPDDPRPGGRARRLHRSSAQTSLSEPDPPGWAYVLFENHPTIMQRIEMADAWQEQCNSGR